MNKVIYILAFIIFIPIQIKAQKDSVKYQVEAVGTASSGQYAPFWLQNNQYGKISANPQSVGLNVGLEKEFGTKPRLFDYGFKANALLQTDNSKTDIYFHELYVKARFSVFDLIIGSRQELLGNQDSTLSGGGFLFSQNARPMPKITVGIEHFTAVPFTKGYVEVKGAISHGWFTDNTYAEDVLLHHKYAYLKFGGKLPVHFQYGFDHAAQWGGNIPNPEYGKQPTDLHAYKTIFTAGSGGSGGEQINALGNHIISQSTRLDVDISDYKISAYWQNIAEDSPIRLMYSTMNVADGLWGFSIKNRKFPYIKGILYEYLNTTDQSGPYHDKDGIIYGGADSYFMNYVYNSGWNHYSRTIGTPFISSPVYNSGGEIHTLNNRVQVHHIGIEGDIMGYQYRTLASFSKNYGITTSAPYPPMKQNTSILLEINKRFPAVSNIEVGCSFGADFGKLYGNSVGCTLSVKKRGNLFQY